LEKGKDGLIDLYAPLIASVVHPIGKKASKAVALEAVSTDKTLSSINKCIVDVSSNLLIPDKKATRVGRRYSRSNKRRCISRRSASP
jgi:hypothetical protein